MYRLTISKIEKNPKINEEDKRFYGPSRFEDPEPEFISTNITIATLDEDQWKKVQKAIIEVIK